MVEVPIQPPRPEAFKVSVGMFDGSHVLGKSLDLDSEALGSMRNAMPGFFRGFSSEPRT